MIGYVFLELELSQPEAIRLAVFLLPSEVAKEMTFLQTFSPKLLECESWSLGSDFIILAWRIPWTEEPGGLQAVGSQSQTRLK